MIPRYASQPRTEHGGWFVRTARLFILIGVWVLVGVAGLVALGRLLA